MFHSSSLKNRHTKNATPTPPMASKRRLRSSSRCSRKLMRAMPSSSSSPSSSGGLGGLGGFPDPAGAAGGGAVVTEVVTAFSVAETPDVDQSSPYERFSSWGGLCAVSPEGVSTPLGSSGDAIVYVSR